jgi:hypothetical protein
MDLTAVNDLLARIDALLDECARVDATSPGVGGYGPAHTQHRPGGFMSETTPESTDPGTDQSSGDTNVPVNGDAEVNTGQTAEQPSGDTADGGEADGGSADGEASGQ